MFTAEELYTTAAVLATAFAALVTVTKGVEALEQLGKPQKELKQEVERQKRVLDEDRKRLVSIEERLSWQNRCMLQVMNHLIDGNHTVDLIQTRDGFQQYLIEK